MKIVFWHIHCHRMGSKFPGVVINVVNATAQFIFRLLALLALAGSFVKQLCIHKITFAEASVL